MKSLCSPLALFLILCGSIFAAEQKPPNIIFILSDDMSWFGTPVRMDANDPSSAMAFRVMPALEKLAQQGMVFSHFRSSAGMCAPSRCSIQTGMMPARNLYSGNGGFGPKTDGTVEYLSLKKSKELPLLEPESQGNIRFPSIGDVLKSGGYATAHFGKWHLYGGGPAAHGYDVSDGETSNTDGHPEVDPVTKKKLSAVEDPKKLFEISKKAVAFIDEQVKLKKPFYLQMSEYAEHASYQARPETLARTQQNPAFKSISDAKERDSVILQAAMAEDLDAAMQIVLKRLDELDIAKNTYLFFMSDNGHDNWNQNLDSFRGNKWWLWENGIRVPFIARGPGISPGSRTDVNAVGYDILPTIAELAGVTDKLSDKIDGVSFTPLLFGKKVSESYVNRPIYFHYPHYRSSAPQSAIIMGDMKLMHFYEHPQERFLFNLKEDPSEKKNIASANPEKAQAMYQEMMTHLKGVGAYFPKPNPDYTANPSYKSYNPNEVGSEIKKKGEKEEK